MKIVAPLILIAAGGVSNGIDRLKLGYVRDPLHIGTLYFNIADICISIGIVAAIFIVYTQKNKV